MKNKHVGLRLGVAFAVLIALLAGIGQFGLRRMQTIDETLGEITGKLLTDLELTRRALAISNDNNRIVMQIVLVKDRALSETLLATRSDNSKEITRLVACRRVTITRLLASKLSWLLAAKSCSPSNSIPI